MRTLTLVCLALSWLPLAAAAEGWGGSLGATSDYVYRGLTLSANHPSLLLDLHYHAAATDGGWFAGLGAAGAQRGYDASTAAEVNAYLGYDWSAAEDWAGKLVATHYAYLGDTDSRQYDHDELLATLSYRGMLSAAITASPNSTVDVDYGGAANRPEYSYELTFSQPVLPYRLVANAGFGYDDLRRVAGVGYTFWSAGLRLLGPPYELDADYVGTGDGAQRLCCGNPPVHRVVVTLLRRF